MNQSTDSRAPGLYADICPRCGAVIGAIHSKPSCDAHYDARYQAAYRAMRGPSDLEGRALVEAESHRPQADVSCSCGFGVWSVEHVLVMSIRRAVAQD